MFQINTANHSSLSYERWVSFTVPYSLVSNYSAGTSLSVDTGNIFVVGHRLGNNISLVHLKRNFIGGENAHISVDNESDGLEVISPDAAISPSAKFYGTIDSVFYTEDLLFSAVEYSDPVLTVYKCSHRVPGTKLLIEGWYYKWQDHPVRTVEIQFISANTSVDSFSIDIADFDIEFSETTEIKCRWDLAKQIDTSSYPAPNRVRLISSSDTLPDSQGIGFVLDFINNAALSGNKSPYIGAEDQPVYACLGGQYWDGHWLIFGGRPVLNPVENTAARGYGALGVAENLSSWISYRSSSKSRWAQCRRGYHLNSGDTSEKPDFGLTKMEEVLSNPFGVWCLDENYYDAVQEICRPSHYRTDSGDLVSASNHPNALFWGESRHQASDDKLGQSHQWMPGGSSAHGWVARDQEHFTANHIISFYALSGSFMIRERLIEIANAMSMGWVSSNFGWYNELLDSPRAVGRRKYAAANLDWCLDRPDLRNEMIARLGIPARPIGQAPTWGNTIDLINANAELIVLVDYPIDNRNLNGTYPFWMPWQLGIAIRGIEAAYRSTGYPMYRTIAIECCRTLINYGFYQDANDNWHLAKAVRWFDENTTLTEAQYKDPVTYPNCVESSSGTDYTLWVWTAVKIAKEILTDPADLARATEVANFCQSYYDNKKDAPFALSERYEPYEGATETSTSVVASTNTSSLVISTESILNASAFVSTSSLSVLPYYASVVSYSSALATPSLSSIDISQIPGTVVEGTSVESSTTINSISIRALPSAASTETNINGLGLPSVNSLSIRNNDVSLSTRDNSRTTSLNNPELKTYKKSDISKTKVDIRKAIENISGHGFIWLGLRQADKSMKCTACNTKSNKTCVRCMGTGYQFTDFLVKGYLWADSEGIDVHTDFGKISTSRMHAVLYHDRPVNEFDFILRLDLDSNTGLPKTPYRIAKYYQVSDSKPIIGESSRVEFWKCNIEETNIYDK